MMFRREFLKNVGILVLAKYKGENDNSFIDKDLGQFLGFGNKSIYMEHRGKLIESTSKDIILKRIIEITALFEGGNRVYSYETIEICSYLDMFGGYNHNDCYDEARLTPLQKVFSSLKQSVKFHLSEWWNHSTFVTANFQFPNSSYQFVLLPKEKCCGYRNK